MASSSGTLYIGMTNNLLRRVNEHKQGLIPGFTKKYSCNKLIYFEQSDNIEVILTREKELKSWRRSKKEKLIKEHNPHWNDLSKEFY